jgi:L-lactate dehydrogenase complex protein LldF
MNHATSERFDKNAREALLDPQLQGALRNLATTFGERRRVAISSVDDWEGLREKARRIKDETLSHLDTYLEQFAKNAEKRGVRIHWARDGHEAGSIVLDLIKELKATNVVKAKSMATEEIHLNRALEAEGIFPVETDLGEWIIQLAGETPSHIVVPAIHKTKNQIAKLFAEQLDIAHTNDVDQLTATAREFLRSQFAQAEVGISGVNFAVAETGTILILENEGNIRLTTGVPKRHIALMGIEKVIPKLEDLDVFLKLLPRSGTGQKLTTYQSLITGVKHSERDEGPEEIHIVIMDNGRSRMLANPVTRQTLACIRCGACLNVCPVYQQIGGHAYGSVYPGPIGAVLTPQLIGLSKAKQLPYASSLCGACRDACPVKIDIPELLLHLRAEISDNSGTSPLSPKQSFGERLAFSAYSFLWRRPALYKLGLKASRTLQNIVLGKNGDGGFAKRFAAPIASWSDKRDLPAIADKSFREIWKSALDEDSTKQ